MDSTPTYSPAAGGSVSDVPDTPEQGAVKDTIELRLNGGPEAPSKARRALGKLRGDICS